MKGELDRLRVNCKPVEPTDKRTQQIQDDMLLAYVKIVNTYNRMIIHSEQSSPPASAPAVDSHASEEDVDEKPKGFEEQDLD